MGSAQRITRENPDLWWYQSSNIAFTNGRVSHWNDASGNLKAKGASPATAAARSLPTVAPPTTYVRPSYAPAHFSSDGMAEMERQSMLNDIKKMHRDAEWEASMRDMDQKRELYEIQSQQRQIQDELERQRSDFEYERQRAMFR